MMQRTMGWAAMAQTTMAQMTTAQMTVARTTTARRMGMTMTRVYRQHCPLLTTTPTGPRGKVHNFGVMLIESLGA